MSIVLPEFVYHGTHTGALSEMQSNGLIDSTYWRKDRDFGEAFYTTTLLDQAKDMAVKKSDINPNTLPCVLKIKCSEFNIEETDCEFFIGASYSWAKTIYDFRIRKNGNDRDVYFSPLADNKIRNVVIECRKYHKSLSWFYGQIIRRVNGEVLENLGDQLVFRNESLASEVLNMIGSYTLIGKGRWHYSDGAQAESI